MGGRATNALTHVLVFVDAGIRLVTGLSPLHFGTLIWSDSVWDSYNSTLDDITHDGNIFPCSFRSNCLGGRSHGSDPVFLVIIVIL